MSTPCAVPRDYSTETLTNPVRALPPSHPKNFASDYNISQIAKYAFPAAASPVEEFKAETLREAKLVEPKTQEEHEVVIRRNDNSCLGVTAESFAQLKPEFSKEV